MERLGGSIGFETMPLVSFPTTGTTLETAWPIIARRHSREVSRSGSCGSVPIAVG